MTLLFSVRAECTSLIMEDVYTYYMHIIYKYGIIISIILFCLLHLYVHVISLSANSYYNSKATTLTL